MLRRWLKRQKLTVDATNFVQIGSLIINLNTIMGIDLEPDDEKANQEYHRKYEQRYYEKNGEWPKAYKAIVVYFTDGYGRTQHFYGDDAQKLLDICGSRGVEGTSRP